MNLQPFSEIWLVDFEFHQPDGECPEPICMVALEARSGVILRFGPDELRRLPHAPFSTGPHSLVVAYYASAEMNCFRALGWPIPANLLDLFAEFANRTNGKPLPSGRKLLGALIYCGLSGISYAEKSAMRDLAIRGGPFTAEELHQLLDYCESDVVALKMLFAAMEPFEVPYALLRGRYMKAVSAMETTGIPVDVETLGLLRQNWEIIKAKLVEQVDRDYRITDLDGGSKYSIYDGNTFKRDRFAEYLVQNNIVWPRLPGGALSLEDDTFRQMARVYPQISELRELRHALSQLRLNDLSVGTDGRNRCLLSPFQSRTGRNQPSSSKFLFGSSIWLRGLIHPNRDYSVAYLDWSGQEYGIAAALSEDPAMMADYQSGDPYLTFAKRLGMVPHDATKHSHASVREAFKVALGLGAMYGAGAKTIATMIDKPTAFADYLLRQHRQMFARFWAWRDAVVDYAMMNNRLWTVFNWMIHVETGTNPRSLSNFPMQANGAEMLRLASMLVTEAGIRLCAPVHDALLIEAPTEQIDDVINSTQQLMGQASRTVLGGFELRTGVERVDYPQRYRDDKRGGPMWDRVMALLAES